MSKLVGLAINLPFHWARNTIASKPGGGSRGAATQCHRVLGRVPDPRTKRSALPMPHTPPPFRVNRAPVLTLWTTVVAERLGYPSETALTLGRFVAGSRGHAKARRLGISDEKQDAEERRARAAELKPGRQTGHLLGRDIPVLAADDGTLRAEDNGKPASAKSVQSYVSRAFGDRLGEARAAMERLAASLPPEELNRVGFRLYARSSGRTCRRARRDGARRGSCGWSGLLGRWGEGAVVRCRILADRGGRIFIDMDARRLGRAVAAYASLAAGAPGGHSNHGAATRNELAFNADHSLGAGQFRHVSIRAAEN